MSKKIDKETLKGPDAFVSTADRVMTWLEKRAKIVAGLFLVAVLGGAAWVGYGYFTAMQEQKATEALYGPEAELRKVETSFLEKDAAAKPSKVADFDKDYAPVIEKIRDQISAHAGTKAALVSSLKLSYFLLQNGKVEKALEVLEIPKYRAGPTDLLGGFWLMHRGLTFLENKNTDSAIAAYQTVLSSNHLKSFHSEALLKLGVAFELKGEQGKAKESYERVAREFPDTEAATAAQQYLRLLELKSS